MSTMRASNAPVNRESTGHIVSARAVALFGLLAGFGVRLYRLGQESLWYDEIVSVDLATAPVPSLIEQTARDIHPPGYYLLLHLWQQLATPVMERGHSFEFLQAFPSLIAGIIICALAWTLTRLAADRATAAVAVWLCALHPFQITYSQEVRMYTLGAALCACYVILQMHLHRAWGRNGHAAIPAKPLFRQTWPILVALPLVTAAGLYTFYYFGFLIAVAAVTVTTWWGFAIRPRIRLFSAWIVLHAIALLVWLPWLPTFLAQSMDPPVPPWRPDWHGLHDTIQAGLELFGVYTAGHALDAPAGYQLLIPGSFALFALFGYANYFRFAQRNHSPAAARTTLEGRAAHTLILFALGPPVLMILLSAAITPLFHVRYVFVFQLPFLVLAAMGLTRLWHTQRLGALAAGVGLAAVCVWGTHWFWTSPTMRSDDHRTAVARLAAGWKPGEVILANAGWTYRTLRVYWPQQIVRPDDALPPPLSLPIRLLPNFSLPSSPDATVPLLYTGSIDATGNLGWQHPQADFYAIPSGQLAVALEQVAQQARGIWQYRLYDTVSDPTGLIRSWLANHAIQTSDTPIAGRDFLRVATYELPVTAPRLPQFTQPTFVEYGQSMTLAIDTDPASWSSNIWEQGHQAGHLAYFQVSAGYDAMGSVPTTAASLRLIDPAGTRVSQHDAPLPRSEHGAQALSLPVPAGVAPGEYRLQLVIYDSATLEPLVPTRIDSQANSTRFNTAGELLDLGTVEILPSDAPFSPGNSLARFDYIHLLEVNTPSSIQHGMTRWPLRLVWWPGPSQYADTYAVEIRVLAQHEAADPLVIQRTELLGPPHYPSGAWLGERPVIDVKVLDLSEELPAPGVYTVELRMVRAADGLIIPARVPYRLGTQEWVEIGRVQVTAPQ